MGRKQYKPRTAAVVGSAKELMQSKSTIDQEVFLADLIEVFGGPRRLAHAMHEEFQRASPGGLARQKLLQTIQHLIISTTQMNLTKVVQPGDLTDEDLEELVGDYIEKIETGRLVSPSAAEAPTAVRGGNALPSPAGDAVDLGPAQPA